MVLLVGLAWLVLIVIRCQVGLVNWLGLVILVDIVQYILVYQESKDESANYGFTSAQEAYNRVYTKVDVLEAVDSSFLVKVYLKVTMYKVAYMLYRRTYKVLLDMFKELIQGQEDKGEVVLDRVYTKV